MNVDELRTAVVAEPVTLRGDVETALRLSFPRNSPDDDFAGVSKRAVVAVAGTAFAVVVAAIDTAGVVAARVGY